MATRWKGEIKVEKLSSDTILRVMTKFRVFRARVCIVGGDVETLWDISGELRKFRECCRYLRGERVRVATFYDVVSASGATFWMV